MNRTMEPLIGEGTAQQTADEIEWLLRATPVAPQPAPSTGPQHKSTLRPSNLIETWDSYLLQIALVGVDPRDLKIDVRGREVTIAGVQRVCGIDSGSAVWRDIPNGQFEEFFTLPQEVDGDHARARYIHGVLTVEIPKMSYLKPASIQVQVVD